MKIGARVFKGCGTGGHAARMDRFHGSMLLGAALVLTHALTVGAQTTPGGNKYYTSSGNSSGYCAVAACSYAACQPWQYLKGCAFNVSGACANCTLPVLGALQYYSGTGMFADNCVVSACQTCANGFYNVDCGRGSPGYCASCGAPATGFYWKPNTGPVSSCTALPITPCSAGQYNTGSSATSPGSCTSCPIASCPIGQYRNGCTGTSSGTCQACTGANNTQQYSTYGLTANADSCTIGTCTKYCPAGQYITNCGGSSINLGCANCTNAVPNVNYYYRDTTLAPAYTYNTCAVIACPICTIGSYTLGCGGTSPGTCTYCINTS